MEKITVSTRDQRMIGYGSAYVISSDAPDFVVGRILTIIETLGFEPQREKALKDIMKQEVYRVLERAEYIDGGLNNIIREMKQKFQSLQSAGTTPRVKDGPMPENPNGHYTLTFELE